MIIKYRGSGGERRVGLGWSWGNWEEHVQFPLLSVHSLVHVTAEGGARKLQLDLNWLHIQGGQCDGGTPQWVFVVMGVHWVLRWGILLALDEISALGHQPSTQISWCKKQGLDSGRKNHSSWDVCSRTVSARKPNIRHGLGGKLGNPNAVCVWHTSETLLRAEADTEISIQTLPVANRNVALKIWLSLVKTGMAEKSG